MSESLPNNTALGNVQTGQPLSVKFEKMDPHEEYAFSLDSAVVNPEQVGLEDSSNGSDYQVITGLELGHDSAEADPSGGATVLVVSRTSAEGQRELGLLAARRDASGSARVIDDELFMPIPSDGTRFTLGRRGEAFFKYGRKLDIENLYAGQPELADDSLAQISRAHLYCHLHEDGSLRILDAETTFGTSYWQRSPQAGVMRQIIDVADVPRDPVPENAAVIETLPATPEQRAKAAEAVLEEFEAQFSPDDRALLSVYSVNKLRKTDAQQRGDGNASVEHERTSGQAKRKMSETAQAAAEEHYRLRLRVTELWHEAHSSRAR